jgi:hypothetical protein
MQSDNNAPPWVIRPVVPEEVYTDRTEHLKYLYEAALRAVTRRAMSAVLLGRRRMGKTEILWSDRADLDGLLSYTGLKRLPELKIEN